MTAAIRIEPTANAGHSQFTEEKLELRKKTLGASEIAAVAGLSSYESALDIFLRKTGVVPPFEGNEYTEWGNRLEPRKERLPHGAQREIARRLEEKYADRWTGTWDSAISRVMHDDTRNISAERVRIIKAALARRIGSPVSELWPESEAA